MKNRLSEILFRGKQKQYPNDWIEGMFTIGKFAGREHHCIERRERRIISYDYEWVMQPYEVIPETVGQYTGLTDKNGKKIFEGDIVSTDLQRRYLIVKFRQGCFMYNCNDGGKDYYDIMLPITDEEQTCDKFVEIIGNIHDNPELLKGGD